MVWTPCRSNAEALLSVAVLSAALFSSGCGRVGFALQASTEGATDRGPQEQDASTLTDSGTRDATIDAQVGIDAAPSADSGGARDAGATMDAGGNVDAGPALDAGADAGAGVAEGRIAWYRFEDDPTDGVLDSTGNGRDGTCEIRGCPAVATGRVGMAYDFDGADDYVLVDDSEGYFDGTDEFSVAFWAFVRGSGSQVFVSKPVGAESDTSWYFLATPPVYTLFAIPGLRTDPPARSFSSDTWVHYVGSWDGTTARFYVDGMLVLSSPGTANFDGSPIVIGADRNRGTQFMCALDGLIDELAIYSRALTLAEIAALANP